MIANQTEDKKLKKILTDSAEVVLGGTTVANAFERYKTVFPVTFIETIRAGEMSGNLDQSFENLQHYFEQNAKIQEKVKSALSYPIFVAIVAVIVLIVIMAKVVPALTQTFASLGGTLPLPTRMLISISGFFDKACIKANKHVCLHLIHCDIFRFNLPIQYRRYIKEDAVPSGIFQRK
jgi:type IV pilus assembly protein PilC